jgi:hypothetical protein
MMKWSAEKAIRRKPNDYEHIGLSAPKALARIRSLVDAAEARRGAGYLVDHIRELAPCLPCWPASTQVEASETSLHSSDIAAAA